MSLAGRPPSRIIPQRGKARGAQGFTVRTDRMRLRPFRGQPLSDREREVLEAIASGDTTIEAARRLFIGHRTARGHMATIAIKLGTRTAAHAVAVAIRTGVLPKEVNAVATTLPTVGP